MQIFCLKVKHASQKHSLLVKIMSKDIKITKLDFRINSFRQAYPKTLYAPKPSGTNSARCAPKPQP